ncbi:MAG: XRE family transcriptional regulator [Candidatus Scalindua sp.]|jgi:DNA polymerase bacteriophage-type|nr:XRE family transcriptional regulator [Candidatus Scalindua sp.]MBT7349852.1 XRE family transcriptional regulator [candidate division WWE3 bacterium]
MAFADNGPVFTGQIFLWKKEDFPNLDSSFNHVVDTIEQGYLFHAHYSMFENYIWHNILVKRYGWPIIPLRQWRCTAALAASHALPRSLENAAKALELSHQKDMGGKRIMLKMCKPRKITKNNDDKWHEDPEDFQKLYEYCIDDVEVEREIDNTLPALSPMEQEVWFLDQLINTRGIAVDMDLVDSAIHLSKQHIEECNDKMFYLTDGMVDKATQVARMKQWMMTKGAFVDSLDKAAVDKLIADNVDPVIFDVLRLRQQVGKTSVAKFEAIKNAVAEDGRVKDSLIYHGASTGRWTGKIFQPHNLPRGSIKDTETCIKMIKRRDLETLKFLYPNVMDAMSSCVRGALVAGPGKDLLVVDFASIEARVLAWVAGEEGSLNEFRTGEDSYVKMAEAIFNTTEITKDMRFVGKTAVLGCGYGMGWKIFQASCASMGQEVSEKLARKAVDAFRKKNAKIKKLWYSVENAAKYAISYPNEWMLNWKKEGDFLYYKLPSGRKLAYHHPKIERKEKFDQMQDVLTFMGVSMGNHYTRQDVWGGTLVENIVQAIARDLLAEAMLRVEKAGYKVVLHVHDEIVAEVPEETNLLMGEQILKDFTNLITTLPDWAKGCPIEAEGWRGKRYRK